MSRAVYANIYIIWENTLHASDFVTDIIKNGYRIYVLAIPKSCGLRNNKSAFSHADFVTQAVTDLVTSGLVLQVPFKPCVVSPLSVSVNSSGKKRLISDLGVLNRYIWKDHFKFEDWNVAFQYLIKGWFCV